MSHKHVVHQIVDRDCHAMSTKLEVVRHVVSRMKGGRRTFLLLPRETRHEIVGAALERRQQNLELYLFVMTGV